MHDSSHRRKLLRTGLEGTNLTVTQLVHNVQRPREGL